MSEVWIDSRVVTTGDKLAFDYIFEVDGSFYKENVGGILKAGVCTLDGGLYLEVFNVAADADQIFYSSYIVQNTLNVERVV